MDGPPQTSEALLQAKGRILSFRDVIGIDAQLWFEEKDGNRSWVAVRFCPVIEGNEKSEFVRSERSSPQLRLFGVYFAAVLFASNAPFLYDREGNIMPLSRRFDGRVPLYRGD
jgi:hypothetical protein